MLLMKKALYPLIKSSIQYRQKNPLLFHYEESFFLTVRSGLWGRKLTQHFVKFLHNCHSRLSTFVTIIPTIPLLATNCHSISGKKSLSESERIKNEESRELQCFQMRGKFSFWTCPTPNQTQMNKPYDEVLGAAQLTKQIKADKSM